jgi:hypothetical protein
MADVYIQQGKFLKAQDLLTEILVKMKSKYGEKHPMTLEAMKKIAENDARQGKHSEVKELYEERLWKSIS